MKIKKGKGKRKASSKRKEFRKNKSTKKRKNNSTEKRKNISTEKRKNISTEKREKERKRLSNQNDGNGGNEGDEKMEKKQQEKRSPHKRPKKDVTDVPEMKRKRVSFAADLEKTKVFDKRHKLTVTPSTAIPGRSIITRKENEEEYSLSSKTARKVRKVVPVEEKMPGNPVTEQVSSSDLKMDEVMQENCNSQISSVVKLTAEDLGEKETEKKEERLHRSDGGKIRKDDRKKKIQVTRKVKEKLLKMSKKERKMYIRELQRKRKPNFDLSLRCKLLWEKLRSGKTNETERKKLASEIYGIVKGKVKELIFTHDMCRVVESMVTHGGDDLRNALFEELTPEIIRMAKSKYSRFFVAKMLKHGSVAQRQIIFDAFRGHCVSLLRIASSAQVLETAYNDYANAQQRYNIIIEFYAVDFAYFKAADSRVRTLQEILIDDPSRKLSIVKYLGQILADIVDKPQIKLSLTHRLLSDYFNFADDKQLEEMIDSLKLHIPEIVHTCDGVRTAMKCLWNSSAKDRKIMLKNFKGLVKKTCMEEFAHRFLIAVFDTVDDTVLVSKYLLKEMVDSIEEIITNNYGIKVMHHLIHPRDPRFCSASQVAIYKTGDGNPYSKKDSKLRYAELFGFVQKPFCNYFAANMETLLYDNHASLLILDMLEAPTELDLFERKVDAEDRAACYDAIACVCNREFVPFDAEKLHAIEHPQAHFVISKLLKSDSKLDVKLGDFIVKQCGEQISSWVACNRGCFILLHMLENSSETTGEFLRQSLSLSLVTRYHTKGATVLAQKLKS